MVATAATESGGGSAEHKERLIRVAFGLGLLVAVFFVSYWPSIRLMAGEWSSMRGVMSHGYLIVAIAAFLFVKAIPEVAARESRPASWLLVILLGLSFVWLLGYVATVAAVQTIVLPAILFTAVFAVYGFKAATPLAFALLFMYFAAPAWAHLQSVFQGITVIIVSALIRVVDIPAYVHGNFVQLSSGTFEIAGGCSGLNFVVAGLSLAVLFGHLYYNRLSHKAVLVLLTLFVAMLGNWIRVFVIIIIGYRTDMQSGLVDDHYTLGWVLFALLMVPVLVLARKMEKYNHPRQKGADARGESVSKQQQQSWWPLGAAVLAMSAGPLWAFAAQHDGDSTTVGYLKLPEGSGQWSGPVASNWDWAPQFAGPDSERTAGYGNNEQFVLTYVNLYLTQEQDRELIYFSNSVKGDWRDALLEQPLPSTVATANGARFRQIAARNYLGNWLIWYRYQIGERIEVSDTRAKIVQALQSLRGEAHAGVIAFATPCGSNCDNASELLEDFVEEIGHTITLEFSRETK